MSINGLGSANFSAMKGLDMRPIEKNVAQLVQATVTAVVGHAVLSAFEQAFKQMGDQLGSILGGHTPQCQPPNPIDSAPPAGSLSVGKDGVITTPGGYKLEATKQFEWTITAPDGKKSTRIWGDPHVEESDGTKWDFKRDSTFVLPDGTRINCDTTPWSGNPNMTVTKGLEIIAGNERVQVTDIDKGKGKPGAVTQDGFAHVNSFGNNDAFVLGGDGDDWTFQGKEIVGSNNGGESFKLGNDMKPLVDTTKKFGGPEQWASQIVDQLFKQIEDMFKQPKQTPPPFVPPFMGGSPRPGQTNQLPRFPGCWNPGDYKTGMDNTFKDLGRMFNQMGDILRLADSLNRRMTTSFSA
jgi:uncharacterized protein DUF1521